MARCSSTPGVKWKYRQRRLTGGIHGAVNIVKWSRGTTSTAHLRALVLARGIWPSRLPQGQAETVLHGQSRLGHADFRTTANWYIRENVEAARKAAQVASKCVDGGDCNPAVSPEIVRVTVRVKGGQAV